MKPFLTFLLFSLVVGPVLIQANEIDAFLDDFSRQLRFSGEDASWRAALSGTVDIEFYSFDGYPPGLLQTKEDHLWQPRATLFLDMQAGPRVYGFAQIRLDRGFDPADKSMELRLDEYAIRITPWKDGRLNLQAGQFATVVGRWTARHLSWQNPFITAPLLYESPTRLSDLQPPRSVYYLAYPPERDSYYYNPVIWGGSYATGFAVAGTWTQFDWAIELKNTSLMSRPEFWSISDTGFNSPTLNSRIAWQPDPRWTIGISASKGSFAGPEGHFSNREDFEQQVLLLDISYEHRHLQIWAELAKAEFSAPTLAADPEVVSWFITTRYKLLPRLSASIRWNEQRYYALRAYGQKIGSWGRDLKRLDIAVTWRFNAHTQLQVEIDHYWSDDAEQDKRFVLSSRLTMRF